MVDQPARPNQPAQAAQPNQATQPAPATPPNEVAPPAPAEKPRVAITISKATTGLTEPLRGNGYVDYLTVLNQRFGQGVTPENNAAALFWKAVGPAEIRPEDRPRYFQMLGIPALPEKGACFANLDKYLTRSKDSTRHPYGKLKGKTVESSLALLHPAMKRPWSKAEFAELAAWIEANEKPLSLVAEASRRPRRYDPLFTEKEGILSVILLPAVLQYHDAAETLLARAMLRVGEAKPAAAWQDLLTCHRLARLIGQGPTLADILTAVDLDGQACAGDQALLQAAKLSAAELAKMRDDLKSLSPLPKVVDRIDATERFVFLDGIALVAREGIAAADKLTEDTENTECQDEFDYQFAGGGGNQLGQRPSHGQHLVRPNR